MRKLILGAVAIAAAASFAPASAETGNGCQTGPGGYEAGDTCTYTATGNATSILVATPNAVSVTWIETICDANGCYDVVRTAYENDSADPFAQGVHDVAPIPAGEEVTVTMGPDCAYDPVCGHIGFVAIAETA